LSPFAFLVHFLYFREKISKKGKRSKRFSSSSSLASSSSSSDSEADQKDLKVRERARRRKKEEKKEQDQNDQIEEKKKEDQPINDPSKVAVTGFFPFDSLMCLSFSSYGCLCSSPPPRTIEITDDGQILSGIPEAHLGSFEERDYFLNQQS
jgi:hypothetical protein